MRRIGFSSSLLLGCVLSGGWGAGCVREPYAAGERPRAPAAERRGDGVGAEDERGWSSQVSGGAADGGLDCHGGGVEMSVTSHAMRGGWAIAEAIAL